MRKMVYAVTALVIASNLAMVGCARGLRSQDEGPIIVQNGSMTIDTASDAQWNADGGAWSNETGKDHRGDLWVRVEFNDGTICSNQGFPLQIDYSVGGFGAIFTVGGSPARTKVAPRGQLTQETNQRLRHGSATDGGFINGVKIRGKALPCTIAQDNLKSIMVCSSPDACK